MTKRVAVLLDGGFVQKRLYSMLGKKKPTAKQILSFANKCLVSDEELFRIYYYDCPPFGGVLPHPMTGATEDYSATPVYAARTALLDELSHSDHVALRSGVLSVSGWKLKYQSQKELIKTPRACVATDFEPDWTQKRVDMKIGLDVAWLASKGIVDRIILVAADTDFIPAMKFARREGVQVILVPMETSMLNKALKEHADEVRRVKL
ncbi:MAG: NYN domain-containing protein [Coriobacteriia bacterium]